MDDRSILYLETNHADGAEGPAIRPAECGRFCVIYAGTEPDLQVMIRLFGRSDSYRDEVAGRHGVHVRSRPANGGSRGLVSCVVEM